MANGSEQQIRQLEKNDWTSEGGGDFFLLKYKIEGDTLPTVDGKIHYLDDKRTCVIPVKEQGS